MYTEIKQNTQLPEDFILDGIVNREKYIVEMGFSDLDKWYDEHQFQLSAEIIGATVIGSDMYNSIRYRVRLESDESFNLSKTTIGKITTSL